MTAITTSELGLMAASALQEVLATQFKISVTPAVAGDTSPTKKNEPSLEGSVRLHGPKLFGSLHLQVPAAWAARLNDSLQAPGDSPSSEADQEDLVGELCNMVAGRLGASLAASGYAGTLSTPDIQRGRFASSEPPPGSQQSRTDWTCEGHLLTLILRIDLNPK